MKAQIIWTKEQLQNHIKKNIKDTYSAMIVIAALYKKIYGEYPKIGMSGFQASCVESIINKLPNKK